LRLKVLGLKLILKFKLRCRFRKRQRQQKWVWKFLFLPGFMLYMEAVIDFVKPEIGETKNQNHFLLGFFSRDMNLLIKIGKT